jgi:putative restriction endonuclease
VDGNYHVMISPAVKNDYNLPGHILTLSDRPVFKPSEIRFWPDQDNLAWHRREKFTKR